MDYAIKLVEDTKRGPIAVLKNDSHMSKWCEAVDSIVHDQTVPLHILPLFNEGDTVVDVGANIGTHTVVYAERVGSSGKVLAFEPYLPSFVCLAVNCRDLPQVELYNCALGSKCWRSTLTIPSDNNMGTVCIGDATDISKVAKVEIFELDTFNLTSCAFIKIDAEGYEPNVILGAVETINKFKPIMYIELNDAALRNQGYTKDNVLELLKLGYDYEFANPSHNLNLPQVDVIMRPK